MGRHARVDVVDIATVAAARDGDKRSLDDLVAEHLPLVYNIVGRALDGHPDVDDVVQETMLRVVRKLDSLRDSSRFRPWLVAIAMQQVRARARARQEMLARSGLEDAGEIADPAADFVDLTITELGLTGQRKEVAEATRWLDPDDRRLLTLWWQEAAGELSREELAAALKITTPHAAVRVQRMKNQLQSARVVVRALWSDRHCTDLIDMLEGWDAKPSTLWRKRLVRHTKSCRECGRHWADLVPAERLLAGISLLPIPFELAARLGEATQGLVVADATGDGLGSGSDSGEGWLGQARERLAQHPTGRVAMYAGAVVLAIGAVYLLVPDGPSEGPEVAAPPVATSAAAEPSPSAWEGPRGSRAQLAEERAPVPVDVAAKPRYGSNVDGPDAVPPPDKRPGELPRRPEGAGIQPIGGFYWEPYQGQGMFLQQRGHKVTLQGQGYFQVRWSVAYYNCGGEVAMPTWTGLKGKLFHAGSGGGRRMDDAMPGTTTPGYTWMGRPGSNPARVPSGAQQMWQVEYYYLHGEVTLNHNERSGGSADYDLAVSPTSWNGVTQDLRHAPDYSRGIIRYGYVRDTGSDGAPVPQYLTRSTPSDPSGVPQRSSVTA
jgi:RNA polymerase sigma factor (sigma-70 family)